MNIETANRLLQYRKQHNLSQEELAEKIGVSRQAVSKWERSEASPDTDNLISLAEVYGVSLDELLKEKRKNLSRRMTTPIPPNRMNPNEPKLNRMKIQTTSARTGFPLRTVSTLTAKTATTLISHTRKALTLTARTAIRSTSAGTVFTLRKTAKTAFTPMRTVTLWLTKNSKRSISRARGISSFRNSRFGRSRSRYFSRGASAAYSSDGRSAGSLCSVFRCITRSLTRSSSAIRATSRSPCSASPCISSSVIATSAAAGSSAG